MDRKVLSYHDTVLYESDMAILNSPREWLNDQLLQFYFEYLEHEVFAREDLLFVPGAVSYLAALSAPPDVAATVAPWQVPTRALVFFAVNNNPYADVAEGGSHWSLLVYRRDEAKFLHYDSMGAANREAARQLAAALGPHFGGAALEQVPHAPQQVNSHACGLHVLAAAEAVGRAFVDNQDEVASMGAVNGQSVDSLRGRMIQIIDQLAAR